MIAQARQGQSSPTWWTALGRWLGLNSTRVRAQGQTGLAYESASMTRRARGWVAPTISPNTAVLGTLRTLRDRSRSAIRNDGYARSAIDRLVSNLIGTGVKPLSQAPDPAFRAKVHALWLDWTDESDADGLLDFYGQQALAVRTWLEAGESLVRIRPRLPQDGLSVPLQVQIVEPELCPYDHNALNGSNRIRAGIEFTPIGKRAAYWMYRSRPGDLQDFDPSQLFRVDAETVIHLYDPVRPGQIRGLPHLTQALVKMHDLDKFDDATLMRQQLSNLFVGFVKQPAGAAEGNLDPLTGHAIETENGKALAALEPGIFQELGPGEDVTFSDPPEVGNSYAGFVRQQMLSLAAAVDVPYELLTGDLANITDRAIRVVLNEFRRRITQRQHQIVVYQFCRRIWEAWFQRAWMSGALDVPAAFLDAPAAWMKVRWIPQNWAYIQPVQDIEAQRDAVRAGFRSRSDVVSEQGEDVEVVDEEIAADNARSDSLGLVLQSDPRKTDDTGKAVQAPAATVAAAFDRGQAAAMAKRPAPQINVHVDAPTTIEKDAVRVETPISAPVSIAPADIHAHFAPQPVTIEAKVGPVQLETPAAAPVAPSALITSEVLEEDGKTVGVMEIYADGRRVERRIMRGKDGRITGLMRVADSGVGG
jgi:lambda family phage portal protein